MSDEKTSTRPTTENEDEREVVRLADLCEEEARRAGILDVELDEVDRG